MRYFTWKLEFFSNIFSQVVDVVILQNVKEKLLQPITDNEKQCWENAQYSRNECLEVAGIVTHLVTRSRWTRYVKYLWNWGGCWWEVYRIINLKKTNFKLSSDFVTGRTLWNNCDRKKCFVVLNLLCWNFHRIKKFLFMRVYSLTKRTSGTNVENL